MPLIDKIPNHLVSKNLELAFTTNGGFVYDRTRGGEWFRFPNDIYYIRKNCAISDNLVLVYGYTKAYVYDVQLGKWILCPEEYSYHDSDSTTGFAGAISENYAVAIGIEKAQVYDFTLHKWFTIHGISWPEEAYYHWTTFPTKAALRLHRPKVPNDWYKSLHYQCSYEVGSGKWIEEELVRYKIRMFCSDTPRAYMPNEHENRCNDNSCPPWCPKYEQ
jgi:hypothetical protein